MNCESSSLQIPPDEEPPLEEELPELEDPPELDEDEPPEELELAEEAEGHSGAHPFAHIQESGSIPLHSASPQQTVKASTSHEEPEEELLDDEELELPDEEELEEEVEGH